jgi:hypothetical protein
MPLTLKPHEARELLKGSALIVRPVKPQPEDGGSAAIELFLNDTPDLCIYDYRGDLSVISEFPFPPGSETWGRETWSPDHARFYPNFPVVYKADGYPHDDLIVDGKVWSDEQEAWYPFAWRSPATMPRRASRFPRLAVATVRACRLSGLTIEERAATGNTAWLAIFEPRWTRDNPKFPTASDPWVWAAMVERRDADE